MAFGGKSCHAMGKDDIDTGRWYLTSPITSSRSKTGKGVGEQGLKSSGCRLVEKN
jgi:hypothetical protein